VLFTHDQLRELETRLSSDPGAPGLRTASIVVDVAPATVLQAAAHLFGRNSYFRTPDGEEVAGLGVAARITAAGVDRFGRLEAALARMPSELAPGARYGLGFSFRPDGPTSQEWDGFAAAELVLPAVSIVADWSRARLVVAVPDHSDPATTLATLNGLEAPPPPAPPDPGSHTVESMPSTIQWQAEVAEAVGAIRGGSFEKVVLARSVIVRAERIADPGAYVFATIIGESAFVGASPELLLAAEGSNIRLNPLAGSARRGEGKNDAAVGRLLLDSSKDRAEHALVVEDLVRRLEPLTSDLRYPPEPSLRRMATVQHLSTEIHGTLAGGVTPLGVLDSIHPTPAVGGTPRSEALSFIDKAEGIDRGWYAGGVGWVDPAGSARVALALRCGLVTGDTARLYAGNGIVADSDPQAELIETRLKFRPMLSLLAAT
jgi:isochorismate synthase